ncbi:MAG: tRNA (guanosine(37)-N1)-methyltransferase TrmD [Deltaproteobacteria bacterium]|nr:tRNA (guanosine(37)-N1)-methyltransferase TrmD [Deltaproteobacteria bacterium]
MRFDLLTLFPELCRGPLDASILGRARQAGIVEVHIHDMRPFGLGLHRQADDTPYGGGSGMVLRVDVVDRALEAVRRPDSHVILLEASGTPFTQDAARRLAGHAHLVLICGHYEGVDARVRDHLADETVSIGDFVLTGGELPALAVVDAVARLVPGVLGRAESLDEESFSEGLLEYPQYTRPRTWRGHSVPEVLLSGHHARIQEWRRERARERTRSVRPDLLDPGPAGGNERDRTAEGDTP